MIQLRNLSSVLGIAVERSVTLELSGTLFAILVLFVASNSYGMPLGELSGSAGSITQGDLLFTNFTTTLEGNSVDGNAYPADVNDIDVQGITIDGNYGLRFTGPFSTVALDGTEGSSRYLFAYDVASLSPDSEISGFAHASYITFSGDAFFQIRTWTGAITDPPWLQLLIPTDPFTGPLDNVLLSDAGLLSDQLAGELVTANSLTVTEMITLSAEFSPIPSMPDGNVRINSIDVVFSQHPVPVPPAVILFSTGFLVLIGIARKITA